MPSSLGGQINFQVMGEYGSSIVMGPESQAFMTSAANFQREVSTCFNQIITEWDMIRGLANPWGIPNSWYRWGKHQEPGTDMSTLKHRCCRSASQLIQIHTWHMLTIHLCRLGLKQWLGWVATCIMAALKVLLGLLVIGADAESKQNVSAKVRWWEDSMAVQLGLVQWDITMVMNPIR